jgi:glycosyltransferase involved in cell wall biosynthesis
MSQVVRTQAGQVSAEENRGVQPGALDGITLMRYAHIYRDRASGGVEQYLRHLDRGLLMKHRMTVLQMHLIKDHVDDAIEVENVGAGRILWVPVAIRQTDSQLADLPGRISYICRKAYSDGQAGRRPTPLSAIGSLFRFRAGHLRYKAAILSDRLLNLLAEQKVDLLALHWLSYDTAALIAHAERAGVPFVFLNHFDNARFAAPQTQKTIARAAAIGAISGLGLPNDLRDRCVNLSDAVDTDFFMPEKAQPMSAPPGSLLLLPARIHAGKGHADLLEAARTLIARNPNIFIAFIGAVESESLQRELRASAEAMGLKDKILFVGEKSAEEMRAWYAISKIVVLPTYAEGLGRVLLEAQAMKTPVVAYDAGGVGEALLPNVTGYLVKKGSVSQLAEKIGILLDDDTARLRMGQRGREFVSRRFSVSALIQRHEAFYLSALSDRLSPRPSQTPTG